MRGRAASLTGGRGGGGGHSFLLALVTCLHHFIVAHSHFFASSCPSRHAQHWQIFVSRSHHQTLSLSFLTEVQISDFFFWPNHSDLSLCGWSRPSNHQHLETLLSWCLVKLIAAALHTAKNCIFFIRFVENYSWFERSADAVSDPSKPGSTRWVKIQSSSLRLKSSLVCRPHLPHTQDTTTSAMQHGLLSKNYYCLLFTVLNNPYWLRKPQLVFRTIDFCMSTHQVIWFSLGQIVTQKDPDNKRIVLWEYS